MAYQGRKVFTAGEVLTSSDMNSTVDQTIMVFADASARDTAIPTPVEGMVCYLKSDNSVLKYDDTDWVSVALDINLDADRAVITNAGGDLVVSAVTASELGFLDGVTSNVQTQLDGKQDDVITTEGDLIIGDASGDASRIAIGAEDTVLTSNGTTATWEAAGGGGGGELYAAGRHTVSIDAGYYLVDTKGSGPFRADYINIGSGIRNLSAFTSLQVSPKDAGETWVFRTSNFGTTDIEALAFGDGVFVAGGRAGKMTTSTDGITWTSTTSGFESSAIFDIHYADGLFVAGGELGKMTTSTDGITWTSRTSSFGSLSVNGIAYDTRPGGLWVAVGSSGTLATSPDGITWTTRTSGVAGNLGKVHYADGLFVAGGNSGALITSPDGITWTTRTSGLGSSAIKSVHYGDGLWLIGGTQGKLRTSPDGITWTFQEPGIGSLDAVLALIYKKPYYVFGAAGGATRTSLNGITWTSRITITGAALAFTSSESAIVQSGIDGQLRTSFDTLIDANALFLISPLPDPIEL